MNKVLKIIHLLSKYRRSNGLAKFSRRICLGLSHKIWTIYWGRHYYVWFCFTYNQYFFFISRFPAKYYCTLIGLCYGLSGVVSFVQYPMLALEQGAFKGNQNYVRI